MKKTVLVLSAAVALSVMTAPAALAQDTGPDTNACEKAKIAEGDALRDVREAEKALRQARDLKVVDVEDEDDSNGVTRAQKQEKVDIAKGKVDRLQKKLDDAIDKREDKCVDSTPETTTPAPTPTPTPEPENDVDCDEVSASEAQRILDEDRNDPNNLDQDKDGIACEVDEILPDSDDDGVTINNPVAVPSGGVATGGGPAWAFQ